MKNMLKKIFRFTFVAAMLLLITASSVYAGAPLPKKFTITELNVENNYVGLPRKLKVIFKPHKNELNSYYSGDMYLKLYGPRNKVLDSIHLNKYNPLAEATPENDVTPTYNKFFWKTNPVQRKFKLYFDNPDNNENSDLIVLRLVAEYQQEGSDSVSLFDREVNIYKDEIDLPQ